MNQLAFAFEETAIRSGACYLPRVFTLTDDQRQFIEGHRNSGNLSLPDTFLAEVRCARRGWELGYFYNALLSYERAREIADEQAIIFHSSTEFMRAYDPDPATIDAIAKRESRRRAEAFQRFLAAEEVL